MFRTFTPIEEDGQSPPQEGEGPCPVLKEARGMALAAIPGLPLPLRSCIEVGTSALPSLV